MCVCGNVCVCVCVMRGCADAACDVLCVHVKETSTIQLNAEHGISNIPLTSNMYNVYDFPPS